MSSSNVLLILADELNNENDERDDNDENDEEDQESIVAEETMTDLEVWGVIQRLKGYSLKKGDKKLIDMTMDYEDYLIQVNLECMAEKNKYLSLITLKNKQLIYITLFATFLVSVNSIDYLLCLCT
jgi:hypothetical protein